MYIVKKMRYIKSIIELKISYIRNFTELYRNAQPYISDFFDYLNSNSNISYRIASYSIQKSDKERHEHLPLSLYIMWFII